jgi:chromosomal replication initiator protein
MRVEKNIMEKTDTMLQDCQELWAKCMKLIKENVQPEVYEIWFKPIVPIKIENNELTLQVPSHYYYEVLEKKYVNLLAKSIKFYLGPDAKLKYSIVMENNEYEASTIQVPSTKSEIKPQNPSIQIPSAKSNAINPFVIPGIQKLTIQSNLNPSYTFETFIEGDCNRLARSAGLGVVAKPGKSAFNPLFIYGNVALGKTHLAHAIGNEIKKIHPNKVVLYVPCEKFLSQFVDSLKNNQFIEFINFYQLIDVLIVDDIQLLSGKEKTQEAFFTVFNHLHQNDKQLILTSDVAPKDLKGIEARLLSRFRWGLSADLQVPDHETRIAILKSKMYLEGVEMPDEIIEYIAHHITTNVRDLEGSLIGLLAQSSFNKKEIDLDLARSVVKNFIVNNHRELSIESIAATVAEYFHLKPEILKEKSRKREIVQARQIAMYFAKEMTKSSLKTIGLYFGGRDHSTVIHAIGTVNDLYDTDKEFRRYVEELRKKFQNNIL